MKGYTAVALALALSPIVASAPGPGSGHGHGPAPQKKNPFLGKEFFQSPVYAKNIRGAVATFKKEGKHALAAKAAKVEKVGTFHWISSSADVPSISPYLKSALRKQRDTGKKQIAQIVVYNLPNRDCSAGASAGEFNIANGGEAKYEKYIKDISHQIAHVPEVQVAIVIEPDCIGNIITNLSNANCAVAAPAHKRGLGLAIALLSKLPNVSLYVDAAHAGWLGWPGNIDRTADLFVELLAIAKAKNPSAAIRGFATNVSNYNGLGNQPQQGFDELIYHQSFGGLLAARNITAHSIVDQGRSGQQGYTREGSDWCNNKYAGFGPRPTTATPDPIIDAVVWVKPGGDADGTSDATATRYDPSCNAPSSRVPAPEAGAWFQAYFEQLITQANPPF